MSTVVKKCRQDGLVYAATYAGQCEQCFAELGYYCKTHNAWLTGDNCDQCASPAVVPPPATSRADLWLVLFFIGCLAVLAGSVTVIWRIVARGKQQPVAPHVVKVVTPPPQPAPLVVPPVELSLRQILADPEPYLGKSVTTSGSVQFLDTTKETFDLRHGDYLLQVRYHATLVLSQEVTVTGVLRRDRDTLYISAQQIAKR
ncbi:MAG: hypothetical protein WCS70_13855 [Verrucomicrobiota bacterium]